MSGDPRYEVAITRDMMIPMRDGIRLATDLYRPASHGEALPGPFPVVLIRTPYNKQMTLALGRMETYARDGYICAVQDVRGLSASEGEFYLLRDEGPDGYDTIEWLADQPWCDGNIGTTGTSYLAWVQSAAAAHNPPHLKAMWVNQGAFNGLTSSLRHGGALELRWLSWAFWCGRVSQEALADPAIAAALDEATVHFRDWLGRLPFRAGETPLSSIPNFERWAVDLQTQVLTSDDLWQSASTNFELHADGTADIPTIYSSGWYDSYTRAATESYAHFAAHKTSRQRLLMGPWTHGDASLGVSFAGDVEFGDVAAYPEFVSHEAQLRFFDHHLKGLANGVDDDPAVRIFVMGGGSGSKLPTGHLDHGGYWRDEEEWPLARASALELYLTPGGALADLPPTDLEASSSFDFDPDNPVPTISANISSLSDYSEGPADLPPLLIPVVRRRNIVQQGGADQSTRPDVFAAKPPFGPLAERPDVLVFETEPLRREIEVTGPITVRLWVSSSAPDTDFTAKLIDVYPPNDDYPDGYALNISDSIKRLRFRNGYEREEFAESGDIVPLTIELYPTSNVFAAGHLIRLDISSSNFPRFDVNPNSGEPIGRQTQTQVARNRIHHDAGHPSHVELATVPSG
jgi:putative CocE/NonD family hydrolase